MLRGFCESPKRNAVLLTEICHDNRDFRRFGQSTPPTAIFAYHWTVHGLKWIADSNSPRLETRFCVQNDQKCEKSTFWTVMYTRTYISEISARP